MNIVTTRLIDCFHTVFPDLPVSGIPQATQASVETWDSTAAILLVNVIEEEFEIQMDLDQLAGFDSFERIRTYLNTKL